MDVALVMTDRQQCPLSVPGPFLDLDQKAFVNTDGSPFIPQFKWSSSDPAIATVEGMGSDVVVRSGSPGQCVVGLDVGPFPDGSTPHVDVGVTITNSAPAPITVVAGTPVDEP